MRSVVSVGVLAIISILAACAASDDTPATRLVVDDQGDVVTGSFDSTLGPITFRGERSGGVYDLTIELDGLVINTIADTKTGVIENDGYAADTGANTQMLDEDRAGLIELRDALDAYGIGDAASPLATLERFANMWADFPSTKDLRFETFAPRESSYTSVCGVVNNWTSATHDCWSYNDWNDGSTLDYAYISMHAACPNADGTYFWKDNQWQCYEPDHDSNIEYAYGNCFGRCGPGCGSGTQFTWDCIDHDSCVRTGHDSASFWCDDEFTSASDDFLFAPNCF
jgi:hypothetical protein